MEHKAVIESTTVDAVQRLLSEHAFLEAFAKEVGVTTGQIDIDQKPDEIAATMPWAFRTDKAGIPSLAQKFLPQEVELQWSQTWQTEAAERRHHRGTARPSRGDLHRKGHVGPRR